MRNKKYCLYILIFGLLINFVGLGKQAWGEDATVTASEQAEKQAVVSIKYQNGRLNADIKSATIKNIFEELKKQTGMNYEIEKKIQDQKVTITLKDKELIQGIKEILNTIGNPSYMLSWKKAESIEHGAKGKKQKEGKKYEISNIAIRKRGSTEAFTGIKRELQDGEMEVGLVDGKYKIRANNVDANDLISRLSSISDIKVFADKIDGKITIEIETGIITGTFLEEYLLKKIRPKIYRYTRHLPEIDRKGNLVKPFNITINRISDAEIKKRREQAQLKNAEGERLMKQGRYLEALDSFEESAGTDRDYIAPLINLARATLTRPVEAMRYLNDAIDITKDDPEIYFLFGEVYRNSDELDSAKSNYKNFLKISKDIKAKEAVKKILEDLDSDNSKNFAEAVKKSDEFEKQNKYEKAEKEILKLIDIEPNVKRSYEKVAAFYMDRKEYNKALNIFDKWKKKNPKDFEIYLAIADVYVHLSKKDLVFENFDKALELAPDKATKEGVKQLIEFYRSK